MFVGDNLVLWKSKKQQMVSLSSAETEYHAMALARCKLVWLKSLLANLGCSCITLMTFFYDNQASMHIAFNLVFLERTKNIEVDCHYIH